MLKHGEVCMLLALIIPIVLLNKLVSSFRCQLDRFGLKYFLEGTAQRKNFHNILMLWGGKLLNPFCSTVCTAK